MTLETACVDIQLFLLCSLMRSAWVGDWHCLFSNIYYPNCACSPVSLMAVEDMNI